MFYPSTCTSPYNLHHDGQSAQRELIASGYHRRIFLSEKIVENNSWALHVDKIEFGHGCVRCTPLYNFEKEPLCP